MGADFTVAPTHVEELADGDPVAVAAENARRKALAGSDLVAREFGAENARRKALAGSDLVAREFGAENARRKALAADPAPLVLGADTLVTIDGEVLGKPRDAAQAVEYVSRLAGRAHHVVGGIALARDGALLAEATEITEVVFRALSAAEVDAYVALGEWEGRAGGYAIQGAGAALVRSITGDYLNVVGLPLARLLDLLPRS